MSKRRIPGHCLHKPTGLGYIRIYGKPYYTGRWKSEEWPASIAGT